MFSFYTTPAERAWETRRARQAFREAYPETEEVAEAILKGQDTQDIVDDLYVSEGTVAAVRANLNRYGDYRAMANRCNF